MLKIIKSPGVLKLFGEHAVIYGKKCAAISINKFATAKIKKYNKNIIAVYLKDKDQIILFDEKLINIINTSYTKFNNNFDFKYFIKSYKMNQKTKVNKDLLKQTFAYGLILANLLKNNINAFGNKIEISSEIPEKKGIASSAACFTAFTIALINNQDKKLKDKNIIEIARYGEIIMHKNKAAGKIDIATSYFGGLILYKNQKIKSYDIKNLKNPDLIIIDTGPKKSTAKTVLQVSKLYEKNKQKTEQIFNAIEDCCNTGLRYLFKNNLEEFGNQMYNNQNLLNKLGVSTIKLNKAVSLAKLNKAYGAKLSGGGGGGIAIAFINKTKTDHLIRILKNNNFNVFKLKVTQIGAKFYNGD